MQSGLPASLECRWVEVSKTPEMLVGCALSDLAKLRNYQTIPISQKYLKLPTHACREEARRFVLTTVSGKIGELDRNLL